MKVVPIETRPMLERTNNARPGSYFYNQMLEGDETSPENFSMQLVRTGDAFHLLRDNVFLLAPAIFCLNIK